MDMRAQLTKKRELKRWGELMNETLQSFNCFFIVSNWRAAPIEGFDATAA